MEPQFCQRCESQIETATSACEVCGYEQSVPEPPAEPELPFSERFAGTEFVQPPPTPSPATVLAQRRRRPMQVVLLLLVFVLTLYGAIVAISIQRDAAEKPGGPLGPGIHSRP